MRKLLIIPALFLGGMMMINTSCKKNEGCTDKNADNYDSGADENSGCEYRFASTIDISNVPLQNPVGDDWDVDGSGADLKVNFSKNTSSGYDYSTNVTLDASTASLTPTSNIQFTNETWKYQVVDDDLLSGDEVIATGTFNPVEDGDENSIELTNNGVNIKFRYTVQ